MAGLPTQDQMFAALLESAPDAMVVVDQQGLVVLANQQTVALFGYAPNELIGESVDVLVPERLRRRHQRHVTGYVANATVRPMGHGNPLFGRRKGGDEFPVEISLSPLETPDGTFVAAAIRDVSARLEGEVRFRALLESAPDAMVIADESGTIVLANHQTERLFGWSGDELVGQPVEQLVPERYRSRHYEHRTEYTAHARVRPMGAGTELYGLRKDGTEFPVEISLSPIATAEGTLVSAAIRDTTERMRTEQRLQRALEREREATEHLRSVDRLKDEFLSIVSHELRTPLTAIAGFAEVLGDNTIDDAVRAKVTTRIAANATQMRTMIEQLLDYSRLEAGKVQVEHKRIDVAAHVRHCLDSLGAIVASHQMEVDLPPELPATGDSDAMVRVLTNLVTNAVKFSPPGSTITVRGESRDGDVVLSVLDRGVGIAAEDVERIFDRFFQATAAASKRGTGIGLSIARRYAELMKGSLTVASTPGEGSTFVLTLPGAA